MLRITKQTDYGILLLTHFAVEGVGALLSTKDLADRTRVPLPTVSKILKILARAGILESQRGAHGGYGLTRPAREITLDELLAALEGPVAMTECAEDEGGDCRIESSCRIRVNWRRINDSVLDALSGISLAEMIQPLPSLVAMAAARHDGVSGRQENIR